MKKFIMALVVMLGSAQAFSANVPERYVRDIEKISAQYNTDMKIFLKSLSPQLKQFNPQQQTQFCGIVKQYVDDMYKTTDQNREYLPLSYTSLTKLDVINKVMASPEMQILKQYNIQCDLK
ncbi:hypothetical protein [Acinetobacter silvestris]|uniref:Uncharacterized protein n=1 Tax=Acinetobacter silvestris TaxID=1977882 RepID=A0A1Y3CHC1_9GAMM|nr:hypothetical protein [Acinetobacter silvestris]OTG66012.1 hypothetical protein B9T28_07390 [Acinetobacter silvestris]